MSFFFSSGNFDVIPDSVVWQHDVTSRSGFADGDPVSELIDTVGSSNATGSGTFRDTQVNGNDAVEIDGTQDFNTSYGSVSGEYYVYAVGQIQSGGSQSVLFSDGTNKAPYFSSDGSDGWRVIDADITRTGAEIPHSTVSETAAILVSLRIDDGAGICTLRVNGNESSGSGTFNGLSGLNIGTTGDSGDLRGWDGWFTFHEIHDSTPSSGFVGREDELKSKFGFSF